MRTTVVNATLAVAALLALTACGGSEADGTFAAGTEKYPLSCLQHQDAMPGKSYAGDEGANTAAVFQMLEYFTANRAVKTYCDGKPPGKVDRAWAQTYVDLGADRANVAHILG
ncbi:MAG: hypothetical protein ACT4QF_07230 [Sporichthyaceae bacterium]